MTTATSEHSLFSELAHTMQSGVGGLRGTATITESIETADTDESMTQVLLGSSESN